MKKIIILFTILLILAACASEPVTVPENLSGAELFQQAQEFSAENKYDIAIMYYNKFIELYPDDIQKLVEAEYEIAFLTYKQGYPDQAKTMFEALLGRYTADGAQVLPAWPGVMSRKIIAEIEEQASEAAAETE